MRPRQWTGIRRLPLDCVGLYEPHLYRVYIDVQTLHPAVHRILVLQLSSIHLLFTPVHRL